MVIDPFVRALADVERTLTASHIAVFPVWCCAPEFDAVVLREKIDRKADDFSHVPIREADGWIRAVVHRIALTGRSGPARQFATPISPEHLLDASTPLLETVHRVEKSGYLLVVSPESGHPDGVSGIINHADIEKLPVRMLLFARLAELESRLRGIVAKSDWQDRADCADQREHARAAQKKWKDTRLPLENYLNLKGLGHIAHKLGRFAVRPEEKATLATDLNALKNARNLVAHGNSFADGDGADPLASAKAVLAALNKLQWAFNALQQ